MVNDIITGILAAKWIIGLLFAAFILWVVFSSIGMD